MLAQTIHNKNPVINTSDGRTIVLKQLIGKKPIYLKFWASWCIPCREQMPHLQETYEKFSDDMEIIAINLNINETQTAINNTVKEFNLTVPIALDENANLAQSYNLIGTPYHVVIDSNGKIVYTGHEASSELDTVLAEVSRNIKVSRDESKVRSDAPRVNLKLSANKPNLVLFTATWCDWYFEKSLPKMSQNCIAGQEMINQLQNKFKQYHWQGLVTRLWTGSTELADYKKKYNISFPIQIDSTNEFFYKFKVNEFPTLIAIKQNKEVFRFNDFTNQEQLEKQLLELDQ